MPHTEPSLTKIADKDLAKEASLSSVFFLISWLFVIYTTSVADDLPVISMIGILLFVLLIAARLVVGLGFDRLYERMTPRRWRHVFGAIVLINGLTWGSLSTILVWHYIPTWPAYLTLICTAILAAGGTNTLNTHLRLLMGFLVLAVVPCVIPLIITNATDSSGFGLLLLLYILFLMVFSRQLNLRYWNSLRSSHQLQIALHKAEAANLAKSQFLANMSHEIRTPLNAVLGFAQVGRRSSQDPDARSRFSHILASGQHLLGIINEILDLSKMDAGKLRVDSIPFELIVNVNDALDYVRESATEKGLNLTVEHDTELPDWVMGDPLRLRQTLINLVGNAIKFTRQGEVRLAVHADNGQIRFAVTDTGIGMNSEEVSRLFKAFEQADGTAARRFGGTGLGLTISNELARLMGGTITVKSTPNQGSIFTLYLPLAKTKPSENYAEREAQLTGARLAGVSVLAVEDDELNRMVLREMLEYEGATLVLAENGQQALDFLDKADSIAFDIVITDVQMPEMNGYEVTRRIHSIAPSLPVVGLTAHAMVGERERCMEAGMVAHITKPVDIDQMMTVLLQHLPPTSKKDNYKIPEAVPLKNLPAAEGPHDSLPGIDIDGALKNLKCDLPTFKQILLTFYRQRRNNCEEITTLLARGDIEQARDLVHGLRGSSGYLGAWKLYHEAATMEDACKAGDLDVALERLSQFRQCFNEVMDGLKGIVKQGINNHSEAP